MSIFFSTWIYGIYGMSSQEDEDDYGKLFSLLGSNILESALIPNRSAFDPGSVSSMRSSKFAKDFNRWLREAIVFWHSAKFPAARAIFFSCEQINNAQQTIKKSEKLKWNKVCTSFTTKELSKGFLGDTTWPRNQASRLSWKDEIKEKKKQLQLPV